MHEATWSREEAIAILDDPSRVEREDPFALWERAGLAPGMTVVEVGAGTGFYAFPASDVVGPTGRVYAVDLSPDLVALVRERSRSQHRRNLLAVRSRPDRVPLPDAVADRVLLANVLHGIPPTTVREAVRLLRPGGRLLDVDWKKRPTPLGPPVEHRLAPGEARRTLEAYGLRGLATGVHGPNHYVVILEKPEGRSARRARGAPPMDRGR
jgi:ubiquinone/menaquinone biosynthesis C-methylase UbiE